MTCHRFSLPPQEALYGGPRGGQYGGQRGPHAQGLGDPVLGGGEQVPFVTVGQSR
ncbi:hypothetical protein [Streptomyces sp. TBY4]|uniref:hypothetical protein n=1 Tax=Streptomyces sp. TBY4 TaxID=2962030 RepID=UPI0020B8D4D8|nr:hypothetical protein [Streptomyces sp. TBY4]MCP3754098.1 hypothetical protein [Streptomyces sp. TBY4]